MTPGRTGRCRRLALTASALLAVCVLLPSAGASMGAGASAQGRAAAGGVASHGAAVTLLPTGLATIVEAGVPAGPRFAIVGVRYRLDGQVRFSLQIEIERSGGGEPARGLDQSRLAWYFWAGCSPHQYAVVYAVLTVPHAMVLANVRGVLRPLHQVAIPSRLHTRGVLVYAVLPALPDDLPPALRPATSPSHRKPRLAAPRKRRSVRSAGLTRAVSVARAGTRQSAALVACVLITVSSCTDVRSKTAVAPTNAAERAVAAARRIYDNETHGNHAYADLRFIGRDRVLLGALGRGEFRYAEAEAHLQMVTNAVRHITRISVTRGGRVLVNTVWNSDGSFVVAPVQQTLRVHGRPLGSLLLSVQDVVGYIKLIKRDAGALAVVRGGSGQVRTSLPAAADVGLPSSGAVSIGGQTYDVGELRLRGWEGEPLSVWVLVPA